MGRKILGITLEDKENNKYSNIIIEAYADDVVVVFERQNRLFRKTGEPGSRTCESWSQEEGLR